MLMVFLVNGLVVALVVMIHYECLYRLTRLLPNLRFAHRYRLVVGVFGAMVAHAVEVWIFGAAYYLMNARHNWGYLEGDIHGSLLDCVYFSFSVYTTLGFGDIVPQGDIRYLTGIEALTGLVLITWTASFLYLEMQRNWSTD